MPKLASAREVIARLMRGVVAPKCEPIYSCGHIEPSSEHEFAKGLAACSIRFSGRKDYVGLVIAVRDPKNQKVVRAVAVTMNNDASRVLNFIKKNTDLNISSVRSVVLSSNEKIAGWSNSIHNYLQEGIKCARLQRLRVLFSQGHSPLAERTLRVRAGKKSSSQSSSTTPSTSPMSRLPTVRSQPTPPIVWTRRVMLPSAAGRSLPSELPSRSRGQGVLHLSSSMTN